jgi:hypothetical protein
VRKYRKVRVMDLLGAKCDLESRLLMARFELVDAAQQDGDMR